MDSLCLLFDLDGTLIDSTRSVERHWLRWSVRHGLDPAKVMPVVHGHRSIDSIALLAPTLDAAVEARRIDADQATDTKGVVAMPHAARLVDELPHDRWAIVTSGTRAIARARLREARLPQPRVLIGADDVREGKPAPDGYLQAARGLGARPDDCVVVEDTPSGLQSARSAGMATIALATTHEAPELELADRLVAGLDEVLDAAHRLRDGARP